MFQNPSYGEWRSEGSSVLAVEGNRDCAGIFILLLLLFCLIKNPWLVVRVKFIAGMQRSPFLHAISLVVR